MRHPRCYQRQAGVKLFFQRRLLGRLPSQLHRVLQLRRVPEFIVASRRHERLVHHSSSRLGTSSATAPNRFRRAVLRGRRGKASKAVAATISPSGAPNTTPRSTAMLSVTSRRSSGIKSRRSFRGWLRTWRCCSKLAKPTS